MSNTNVTRRQFLKLAGGLAAGAAVSGGVSVAYASGLQSGGADASRTTGRDLRSVATCCQLCQARCGLLAFVQDERVVKVEGNPEHPNNRGRICAKGQAAPNLVHSPDRLLYPMRRAGRRGEGKWERISWSQALDEVASRLKSLRASGHPEQLVFQAGTMATPRFVERFCNAFGTPNAFFSVPSSDTNRRVALSSTWGAEVAVPDVARTRYVLNFGSNPYEAHWYHVPLVERLVQARLQNAARLVTFDVRLSKTAGKSDEWLPLEPGTDGLVALSLASVIMEEGLFDASFVDRWTNYDAAALTSYLAQYGPERVSDVTGVAAADIRRIAREFASARPAVALSGTGVSMRQNGVQGERSVFLLNVITGNIDTPGGMCLPRAYDLPEVTPAPPRPMPEDGPVPEGASAHLVLPLIGEGKLKAGVYMTYMFNPAYSNASNGANAEVLKDERLVPYVLAIDILPSETVALADIVLPDTTFLERWDLESGPSFEMVPFVALRQPVVKSPGLSAPFHDVCTELGRRVGGGMESFFSFRSAEEYIEQMARKVPGLDQAGGLDYLKQHGVWYDASSRPGYGSYRGTGFRTPSGKVEVDSADLRKRGGPGLPSYQPVDGYGGAGDGQLFLVTYKWSVLTSSMAASKWLSEIVHDNLLLVNRATARARGIDDGDVVEVSSSAGSAKVRVRLTEGIHPRVVALPTGTGHWGLGGVARGAGFRSDDPDTRLIWWNANGVTAHANAVIPVLHDGIGHGQAWHDTVVTLKRAGDEA